MTRKIIPIPRVRRDVRVCDLELSIQRALAEYYTIAPGARVAFFLNNVISEARRRGRLLPAAEQKHIPLTDE